MGNRPVISKEQILDAAYEIATTKGLGALSIRAVAAACGVAVGTVYNSYPTKSDLVNDVVGRFWQRAFSDRMGAVTAGGVAGLEEGGARHDCACRCRELRQRPTDRRPRGRFLRFR
ncbi:MAG: TetR family transcriptional regulator [Adlercreutzia equolifaciens]